jgi:putative ubiquitin-RnfH superfamily antitoxin RatB of RatAB toxin-antitoxin module
MRCTFAAALPSWQGVLEFDLPEEATVADVLQAARERIATLDRDAALHAAWDGGAVGIFGQVCERSRRVLPQERVELYLPLSVDPKAARRARARPAR